MNNIFHLNYGIFCKMALNLTIQYLEISHSIKYILTFVWQQKNSWTLDLQWKVLYYKVLAIANDILHNKIELSTPAVPIISTLPCVNYYEALCTLLITTVPTLTCNIKPWFNTNYSTFLYILLWYLGTSYYICNKHIV